MQMDKINLRILLSTRQFLLYTVGLGAIILILVSALLIPQAQVAYETFTEIQIEKPKTDKLTKKLSSLESITATAEFAQIDVVEKALPSKKPVLELLTGLSSVSQNTGVNIDKFDITPGLVATDEATVQELSKGIKPYESLIVELEVSGSFKQVQDFIIQVERFSPFTTVTQMDLSGVLDESKAADVDQRFRAVLTTETYFFTQAIAVKIDTPLPLIAAPEQSVLSALAAFSPTNLQEQTEVTGGGLDDLFKSGTVTDTKLLETLLNERNTQASGSATTP